MAGTMVISTLNNDTGPLATQNGMTGVSKAWVRFQGGNGNTAGVILASFNVSSITVNGTGDYTVNFTTAMSNANYCAVGCGDTNNGVSAQHIQVFWNVAGNTAAAPTTTTCRVANTATGSGVNTANICIVINGT